MMKTAPVMEEGETPVRPIPNSGIRATVPSSGHPPPLHLHRLAALYGCVVPLHLGELRRGKSSHPLSGIPALVKWFKPLVFRFLVGAPEVGLGLVFGSFRTTCVLGKENVFKAVDLKYNDNETDHKKSEMNEYVLSSIMLNLSDNVLRKLVQDIKMSGDRHIDDYTAIALLNAIPETYNDVKSAIKYGMDDITFDTFVNRLKSKEMELKHDRDAKTPIDNVMHVREKNLSGSKHNNRNCYNCDEPDHYAKHCRNPKDNKKQNGEHANVASTSDIEIVGVNINSDLSKMWHRLRDGWLEILSIQKFQRIVSYTGFYCFTALIRYAYCNNTWMPMTFSYLILLHYELRGDFNLSNFEDGVISSAFMVGLLMASLIFASSANRRIVCLGWPTIQEIDQKRPERLSVGILAADPPVRANVLHLSTEFSVPISEAVKNILLPYFEKAIWFQNSSMYHFSMFHASHHIAPVPTTETEIEAEAHAVEAASKSICPMHIVLDRIILTPTGVLLGCWHVVSGADPVTIRAKLKDALSRAPQKQLVRSKLTALAVLSFFV
ncbi:transmembrane protein [Perilla frutescens var. frutescens]|nr:transmembrane protein [Perilla frutescens var. frutescens]